MQNIIFPILGTLQWSVGLWRVIHLLRQPTLRRALLCAMLLGLGTSFIVATPAIYRALGQLLGIPNIGALIVFLGITVFATFAVAWLTTLVYPPPRARPRILIWTVGFTAAITAMISLFTAAPVNVEAGSVTAFEVRYAGDPYIAWMLATLYLTIGAGLIAVGTLYWRWRRQTDRTWLKRGLLLISLGAFGNLADVTTEAIYVGLRQAGERIDLLAILAPIASSLASLLLAAGFALPLLDRVGDWRAYQTIHPLWRELATAYPHVVLPGLEGPRNPRLAVRHLGTLLYRRYVETRDARLYLRRWIQPDVTEQARHAAEADGLFGEQFDAAMEAWKIRVALNEACKGKANPANGQPVEEPYGGSDYRGEVRWLVLVAREFAKTGATRLDQVGA